MPMEHAVERQNLQDNEGYLQYLPEHLRGRYIEGLRDAQLTHLRRQIALADVRVKMLLETLDRRVLTAEKLAEDIKESFGELDEMTCLRLAEFFETYLPDGYIDTKTFRSLDRLTHKYDDAMAAKNLVKADQALRQLFEGIRSGRRDGEIWKEIDEVMDGRRKLVEAEERRLVHTQQTLSVDRVITMVSLAIQSLRMAVVRYVPEREDQTLILTEAERIYSGLVSGEADLGADAISLDG